MDVYYNFGKETYYQCNMVGDLMGMTDRIGMTLFEMDLLNWINKTTGKNSDVIHYMYNKRRPPGQRLLSRWH